MRTTLATPNRFANTYVGVLLCAVALIVPGCADKGKGGDPVKDTDTEDEVTRVPVDTETTCSEDVPAGAIVTCKMSDATCRSGEKWTYVTNAADLASGTQLVICGSTAPSGWTILSRSFEACCPGDSPNAIRIQKD